MADSSAVFSHTWPAQPEHVGEARRAVVDFARGAGADAATLFGIELAVSEACTNAIVHGYADEPAKSFNVEAKLDGPRLQIVVRDHGRGMLPRPDSPGLGLGLPLIATLAESLELGTGMNDETEVRMTFRLDTVPADDLRPQ